MPQFAANNLFFVTGNEDKLLEAKSVLPQIKQAKIHLPEIQSLNPKEIIANKLAEAHIHARERTKGKFKGQIVVEDTSLFFAGLHGLPGPLAKWFLKGVGAKGIYQFAWVNNVERAIARVEVGYSAGPGTNPEYFSSEVEGVIVSPRGEMGFGWDPVFLPNLDKALESGEFPELTTEEVQKLSGLTFGQLTQAQKALFNPRIAAFKKLKEFLG